jgi:hypothetical protein
MLRPLEKRRASMKFVVVVALVASLLVPATASAKWIGRPWTDIEATNNSIVHWSGCQPRDAVGQWDGNWWRTWATVCGHRRQYASICNGTHIWVHNYYLDVGRQTQVPCTKWVP